MATALAAAHADEGNRTAALALLEDTGAALGREIGPDHPDSITARHNLGLACLAAGRPGRAYELVRASYESRRDHRSLGPLHRDTLLALNSLAIVRGHLGATSAERARSRWVAHRLWLAAHERWRRVARPDDQYALDVRNGLGLSYRVIGRPDEALAIFDYLRERRERLLGPEHPDTVGTAENALIVRADLGEPTTEGFWEVLRGRLRAQGPGHPRVGVTRANLIRAGRDTAGLRGTSTANTEAAAEPTGAVRLDGDHVDDEIDLQQLAMDWQESCTVQFGPDDPRSLMATCWLAYSLAAADHLDGQIGWALQQVEESWPGIADAFEAGEADPADLEIATTIRDRVRELAADQEP